MAMSPGQTVVARTLGIPRRSFLGAIAGFVVAPLAAFGRIATAGPPAPIRALCGHLRVPGGFATAIYREWRRGDAARCTLCPPGRCCAVDDRCLVQVGAFVPREQARGFDSSAIAWQPEASVAANRHVR